MSSDDKKHEYPNVSDLSLPYAVAITELETELCTLKGWLQSAGIMDGHDPPYMSPYWIRPGAFDENVSRSLQKIFRIYAETARIRFSEVYQKQPTLYDTIGSPGRRCYSDGRCVDLPETKGGD